MVGYDLPRQIFMGSIPDMSKFNMVSNIQFVKPSGGLWTSPIYENDTSYWEDWCTYESPGFIKNKEKWIVVPYDIASVYKIDSLQDLLALLPEFGTCGFHSTVLNFEKMSETFDIIYLTSKGQNETRMSYPVDLYGWDCESCLWLNWEVKEVIPFTPAKRNKKLTPANLPL